MRDLRGLQLLIVEDEWLLAGDLARYFSNMGAIILGPAATLEQASIHTHKAEAAILDVNINGRRVFPIADELLRRGVPFVFFSGDNETAIPERLRYVSNLRKSAGGASVVNALFPSPTPAAARPDCSNDVFALLPKLRLAARLLLADPDSSDRLVEHTLKRAIQEIDGRSRAGLSTEDWLNGIMSNLARSAGAALLN